MYEQQKALLARLTEKTKIGGLDWKKTADDDALQVSFRMNTVRLVKTDLPDYRTPSYTIEVIDGNGTTVEEFSDSDLDMEQFGKSDQTWYRAMRDMYETARRRAFGAEKVISEILKDLE